MESRRLLDHVCLRLWMLLMLASGGLLPGAVWHVRSGGGEGGDGTSWERALVSLERALEVASAGDSIWLCGGIYEPTALREIEGEEAFGASFHLKDGVSVFGGFRGDEHTVSERRLKEKGIYGWEFESETVLRQKADLLGSVLRGPEAGLRKGCELNGLVIEGGRALGTYEEGWGGGIYGHGRLTVVNCLLRENVARNGGGIYWSGALSMMCTGLFDNDLVAEGWSGTGGGGMVEGDGYRLCGIVCVGNGTVMGGVQSGGGLYLGGKGVAVHCTIVGNRTSRNGSGVWLAEGAKLENALVWGNLGRLSQVVLDGGTTATCGIECWSKEDTGDIPLLSENCGAGGTDANDNWVDGYYPCFVSLKERDFRLGAGSYGLNRGGGGVVEGLDALGVPLADSFPADLGACGSRMKGNLALDFSVEHPHLYGGESQLLVYYGMGSPEGIGSSFLADEQAVSLEELAAGDWIGRWLRAGLVEVTLQAEVQGVEMSYWHGLILSKSLTVKPRPLLVSATDMEYRHGSGEPQLEWSIAAGRLVLGDQLTGTLACTYSGQLGNRVPITQGSLTVEDGNDGKNYRLSFLEGEMTYAKGLADLAVAGNDVPYDGNPLDLAVTTEPEGLETTVIYKGTGETEYGPSEEPPTDAGEYVANIEVQDDNYEGSREVPVFIRKVVLTATAEDKHRLYGEENPVLTVRYEGFVGGDGEACLEPPVAETEATRWSPVKEGGYAIVLQGGGSRNYELDLVPGRLLIARGRPDVGTMSCTGIEYGDSVEDSSLKRVGGTVAGGVRWNHPEAMPGAGESVQEWVFTPEDAENWEPVTGTLAIPVSPRKITVGIGAHEQVYGDAQPDFQVRIESGSLVDGDQLVGSPACDGRTVGEHVIGAGTLSLGKNYDLTVRSGNLIITARPVTLKAADVTKGMGEDDPDFRWEVVSGSLVPGEEPTGSLVREAGEEPGSYRITQGSLQLTANYELTFVPGRLTVIELLPVLDAGGVVASVIRYGDKLETSNLQGKVRHPKTGEEIAGTFVWDMPELCPEAGKGRHGWSFAPAAGGARMSTLRGECEVQVLPAILDVRLVSDDLSRPFFSVNPTFSLEYSGFVNGDDASDLLLCPEAVTEARLTSPVGRYAIRLKGGLARNYQFRYHDCELEIVKAVPLVMDPVCLEPLVYGVPYEPSMLQGTFVPPEPIGEVAGRLELLDLDAGTRLDAGTYECSWRFLPRNENFEEVHGVVQLEVRKAPLTVKAHDVTILIDEPLPEQFAYDIRGFVYGETPASAGVDGDTIRIGCEVTDTYYAGSFPISLSADACKNYELVLEDGWLTIACATPVPVDFETVVIYFGDELREMPTMFGNVWSLSKLPNSMPLDLFLNHEILVYYDRMQLLNGESPDRKKAYFRGLAKAGEPGPHVPGVVHWEWNGYEQAGTYKNVPWRFVPAGDARNRYEEITGTSTVIVEPKPVEIIPPKLDYLRGNCPEDDLVHNEDWSYRAEDLQGEDGISGTVHCDAFRNLLDGWNAYVMSEENLKPQLNWSFSQLKASGNYRLFCYKDIYHVSTRPRQLEVQWEDYRATSFVNVTEHPVFKTRLLNGVDRSEKDWSVRVSPNTDGMTRMKYPYKLPEPYVHDHCIVARYVFPEDTYPKHFYLTSKPVVDVLSRNIMYGDGVPEPEFAVKFSQTLTAADVLGAPEYVDVKPVPGTYRISRGTLRMADPAHQVDFCEGVLTIRKRPLVIRTGPVFKAFGEEDPVPTYEIVSGNLLPGDELTGELSRKPGVVDGLYPYMVGTLSHPYYEISITEDSYLKIVEPPRGEVDNMGLRKATVEFGKALSTARFEDVVRYRNTGKQVPGEVRFLRPQITLPVGQHWEWTVFYPESGLPHEEFPTQTLVTVLPKELTVVADNQRIAWGDPLPVLTYRLSEQFSGDVLTGELSAERRDDWHYDIVQGSLSAGDGCKLSLVPGAVVNVHRRHVVLEVLNSRKAAGAADPQFTYRLASGSLAPGDRLSGVSFVREPGEAAGTYEVTMTLEGTALDPGLGYYDLELLPGVLEIVDSSESPVSSQRSKIVVNASWATNHTVGDEVSWGGGAYVYGVNGFSTLEAGLAAVSADGVVLIAPGVYEAESGSWFVNRGVSLIGDDEGDVDSEIILMGALKTSDNRVSKLLLSNLSIVSGRDSDPAVSLADNVGSVVIVNCRIIGGQTAMLTGAYGNGVSVIYSEITATDCCLRGVLGEGQGAPVSPLTLVCNIFEGETVLEAPDFSVISSSNLHNGACMEDLGQ